MNRNSKEQLIESCLSELMPAEVDLVGREGIEELVGAVLDGENLQIDQKPTRGRTNDIILAVELLFKFAAFIKTAIDIYVFIRDRNKKAPTDQELIAAIANQSGQALSKDEQKAAAKVASELQNVP